MKKVIAFVLSVLFSFTVFTACDGNNEKEQQAGIKIPEIKKYEELTEENVTEALRDAVSCYALYAGSFFYEIEKDERGNPIEHGYNDNGDTLYRIVGVDNFYDVIEAMALFLYNPLTAFEQDGIPTTIDGELYVPSAARGSLCYDLNSIQLLEKNEEDYYPPYIYEVSIDIWNAGGGDGYYHSQVFLVNIYDGTPKICPMDEYFVKDKEDIPDISETYIISELEKFS